MFDDVLDPATCGDLTQRELIDAIAACHRTEATVVARKLAFTHRLLVHHKNNAAAEEKTWAHDEWAYVRDQVGPAMRLSPWRASGQMRLAEGLARNPHITALLHAGKINVRVATTIIYRTELVSSSAQAIVDAEIAADADGYTLLSEEDLASALDAIIEVHDPDAVRRYKDAAQELRRRLRQTRRRHRHLLDVRADLRCRRRTGCPGAQRSGQYRLQGRSPQQR